MLTLVQRSRAVLAASERFDVPGFRPNEHYVREMKRMGFLSKAVDAKRDPIGVYAVDRAYWHAYSALRSSKNPCMVPIPTVRLSCFVKTSR
jgi:hypothetical protein